MKRQWQRYCAYVDARTLRERLMIFSGAAAAMLFLAWSMAFGPMLARHKALRAQIAQMHNNMSGIDAEITRKLEAWQADPDAAERARLEQTKAGTARLTDSLRAMQKGLVPPERMPALLDTILRANGRLQLASMKTLAVTPLSDLAAAGKPDAAQPAAAAAAGAPMPPGLLYRHGVEVSVRGNYLDLVNYMTALEAMPTQLFWGKAQLEVEQYPTSRLTLTLYTLSLDPTWMKL